MTILLKVQADQVEFLDAFDLGWRWGLSGRLRDLFMSRSFWRITDDLVSVCVLNRQPALLGSNAICLDHLSERLSRQYVKLPINEEFAAAIQHDSYSAR